MHVVCMFFYMHCPVNTSSNRGYPKKRLQSLVLLPFCKATIKRVYAIRRFCGQHSVIFYFRILWSRHTIKTLTLKVSLYDPLIWSLLESFKLRVQTLTTNPRQRQILRCKAINCKLTFKIAMPDNTFDIRKKI